MVAKGGVEPDDLQRGIDAGLKQAEEDRTEGSEVAGLPLDFNQEPVDGFFKHGVEAGAGERTEVERRLSCCWRFNDDRIHKANRFQELRMMQTLALILSILLGGDFWSSD